MNNLVNNFLTYFNQLQPRERAMLIVAGVVVSLMVLYLAIWEPFMGRNERLANSVREQAALVQWMEQSAAEAKSLRGSQRPGVGRGAESVLGIIDRTAKSGKLGEAMKRVDPDGTDRVRVWLDQAPFDDMVVWLERIERDYKLTVDTAVIDSVGPGRVSARLVIEGS